MDRVDMHVHTTASDGTLSPRDVTSLAAMKGLKAIAITDHDTMAGIPEAGEAGELLGVTIIPGIEVSTDYQGQDVHVLGYFLSPEAPALKKYEAWVSESRRKRNQAILDKLKKKGYDISLEALEAGRGGATIGRPHIARALMDLGAVGSVKEAFRRYLDRGRSCYVDRERIPFREGAKLIRDCGGLPVLANPLQYDFTRDRLDALVKAARDAGFGGIEVLYSGYTAGDQKKLYDLAEKYLLLPTGGSDFHGENKPEIQLGEPPVPAYMLMMLAQSQFR